MTLNTRTVKSTSRSSAVTDDIVLRKTTTTRLVFRPLIIANPHDSNASVRGGFIFQRKASGSAWEDIAAPPLTSLKHDEAVKLELKSKELLTLHRELSQLYDMFSTHGIPRGEARFVRATATIQALARMTDDELDAAIGGEHGSGAAALSRLMRWAGKTDNFPLFVERLEALSQDAPGQLKAALGVATMKRALKQWVDNRRNDDEEFWQGTLTQSAFVIEQIFHVPIVIIKSKAYVGGKSVLNTGGKVVDFLVKNRVTNAVALVEIKTPMTPLLGSEYRDGIYNPSTELNGAVMQVLSYRDSLTEERRKLLQNDAVQASCFDPACLVILGHARRELVDENRKRSFELYRRQLSDVTILTFDELYVRTRRLVELLEGGLEA